MDKPATSDTAVEEEREDNRNSLATAVVRKTIFVNRMTDGSMYCCSALL